MRFHGAPMALLWRSHGACTTWLELSPLFFPFCCARTIYAPVVHSTVSIVQFYLEHMRNSQTSRRPCVFFRTPSCFVHAQSARRRSAFYAIPPRSLAMPLCSTALRSAFCAFSWTPWERGPGVTGIESRAG